MNKPVERIWKVNGQEVKATFEPDARLLDVLREGLGLTGTKEGCGEGECGACSVMTDGLLRLSCLTLAVTLPDGTEIMTVEGVEQDPLGVELQRALLWHGAVQCGYCFSGMTIAAYWVLKNPEIPVRKGLAGNICRCTGYQKIFEAVEACRKAGVKGGGE